MSSPSLPLGGHPGGRRGARTLRHASDLVDAGLITRAAEADAAAVAQRFSVAVPPAFVSLIDPDDPNDPIAVQVLPDPRELDLRADERADPIGDAAFSPVRGVTHRYPDRVLLKPVMSCPLYCRFCFRREVVGRSGGALTAREVDAAIAYVRARDEVREVILTGGDPLLLAARRLGGLLEALARIDHVELLRIHTRVPVAEPGRIDRRLVAALRQPKAVWLSVHVNHARELGADAVRGLGLLADAGVPLLAQTVLLRGVNDDAMVLETLFRRLVALRVKPYYLHHPDLAPGTAHFRVGIAAGQALVRSLRGRLGGHALPTYVLDIPGGAGKVPVEAPWVEQASAGVYRVRDPRGGVHRYADVLVSAVPDG